jgi:hypothetical protein
VLLLWTHRWTGWGGGEQGLQPQLEGLRGVYFWHPFDPRPLIPTLPRLALNPTQKGLVWECQKMPNASLYHCPLPQSLGMSITPPGAGDRKGGAGTRHKPKVKGKSQPHLPLWLPPNPCHPPTHACLLYLCPVLSSWPLFQDRTSLLSSLLFLSAPPLAGLQSSAESLETALDLLLENIQGRG